MPGNVPLATENILVVKRSLFDELGAFQGLAFDPQRYLGALLSRGNNFFLPRAAAENDSACRQYERADHGTDDRTLRCAESFGAKHGRPQVHSPSEDGEHGKNAESANADVFKVLGPRCQQGRDKQ